jgi:hypothetical protein
MQSTTFLTSTTNSQPRCPGLASMLPSRICQASLGSQPSPLSRNFSSNSSNNRCFSNSKCNSRCISNNTTKSPPSPKLLTCSRGSHSHKHNSRIPRFHGWRAGQDNRGSLIQGSASFRQVERSPSSILTDWWTLGVLKQSRDRRFRSRLHSAASLDQARDSSVLTPW